MTLDQDSGKYLKRLYQSLYDAIEKKKKKLFRNSIILTFFKTTSNNRSQFLNDSSIPGHRIPKEILRKLENENLVRSTSEYKNYAITCKGVWLIESSNKNIGTQELIGYIDAEYFNLFEKSNKPIRESDKVILFAMIATRTFSDKSPVDLSKSDYVKNAWGKIFELTQKKLVEYEIISSKLSDILKEGGNVHPVSDLFRHATELPKITKGIYVPKRDYKYYLNLYKNGKIDEENLVFLIKIIFNGKNLSISNLEDINNFCSHIAHDESAFVLNPSENIFWKHEYDDIIREALFLS